MLHFHLYSNLTMILAKIFICKKKQNDNIGWKINIIQATVKRELLINDKNNTP